MIMESEFKHSGSINLNKQSAMKKLYKYYISTGVGLFAIAMFIKLLPGMPVFYFLDGFLTGLSLSLILGGAYFQAKVRTQKR